MRKRHVFNLGCLAILFIAVNIFIYGCGILGMPEHKVTTAPEEPSTGDTEDEEPSEMPKDHAAYSSAMCVHCHHLTSLSDIHQGVSEDECLDCHQMAE